jgi:hypothetical protein
MSGVRGTILRLIGNMALVIWTRCVGCFQVRRRSTRIWFRRMSGLGHMIWVTRGGDLKPIGLNFKLLASLTEYSCTERRGESSELTERCFIHSFCLDVAVLEEDKPSRVAAGVIAPYTPHAARRTSRSGFLRLLDCQIWVRCNRCSPFRFRNLPTTFFSKRT